MTTTATTTLYDLDQRMEQNLISKSDEGPMNVNFDQFNLLRNDVQEEKASSKWILSFWRPNMTDNTQLTISTYV